MYRYWLIILFALFPYLGLAQLNNEVRIYMNEINPDSLRYNIEVLQDYSSRYAFNPNRKDIANYLKERLINYGWDAKLDSFYMDSFEYPYNSGIINTGWQYNVMADKIGIHNPDTLFIVGAHYDSYASFDSLTYFLNSPGADDNASGVAVILEIARLFQKYNIEPTKTLRIEFYAAEELGLHGSNIAMMRSNNRYNEHISAMMNLDMVGYKSDSIQEDSIKLISYDNSQIFTDFCEHTTLNYTSLLPLISPEGNDGSDSWIYYAWGRRAIFIHEYTFNPFYHTSNDIISNINFNHLSKVSELAFAISYLASSTDDFYPISITPSPTQSQPKLILLENPIRYNLSFIFSSYGSENPAFQIINQLGKVEINSKLSAYQTTKNHYKIPIQNLKSGMYFLKVGNQVQKFVIIGR